MKKLIALVVALILCLTAFSAIADASNVYTDDIWPVVKEKISVSIGVIPQNSGEYDPDSMWLVKYWNEHTNLDIDWQIIEKSSAKEKVPLLMESNDMPDAIMGWTNCSAIQVNQWGAVEGLLYPLNELTDYMPNVAKQLEEKPALRKALTTSDGNIYSLPKMGDGSPALQLRNFINNDWLAQLEVEAPDTLDEFYEVLCAFRDNDMNGNGDTTDEIPWVTNWSNGKDRALILNAYNFCTAGGNAAFRYNDDGSVEGVYIPYEPEYKEYLTYMNKLWTEGLMDLDTFTQNQNQVNAKFVDGVFGVGYIDGPSGVDASKEYIYSDMEVLAKEEGGMKIYPLQNVARNVGMFMISSKCDEEKAAALANFADSFFAVDTYGLYRYMICYSEEDHETTPYGDFFSKEFGHYYDPERNVIDYVYDTTKWSSDWTWRSTEMSFWSYPGYCPDGSEVLDVEFYNKYPDLGVSKQFFDNGGKIKYEHFVEEAFEKWTPYYKDIMPQFFFSAEDQDRVTELKTLLDDYVSGMEAKFITGAVSIEDGWDEFMQTLDSYGVAEYAEILARYTEAYNAN